MRWRLLRTIQFASRAKHGGAVGRAVFSAGEEAEEVALADLDDDDRRSFDSFEARARRSDPQCRLVVIQLGSRPRFLQVGRDVEPIPGEQAAPSRSAARPGGDDGNRRVTGRDPRRGGYPW